MLNQTIKIIFIIVLAFSLFGCRNLKQYDPGSNDYKAPEKKEDIEFHAEPDEENLFADIRFDYPAEWHINFEENDTIILKDVEQDVLLSTGFAPVDYFIPNGMVNDEKYSEHYILVKLQVIDYTVEKMSDWNNFIRINVPDIVSFENVDLDSRQLAIRPIEFSGIMLGNKIMIVAVYDKVVIASLHYQARTHEEAEDSFMLIIESLR